MILAEVIGGYDSVEEVVYLLPVLERHLGRVARIARADADDHAMPMPLNFLMSSVKSMSFTGLSLP